MNTSTCSLKYIYTLYKYLKNFIHYYFTNKHDLGKWVLIHHLLLAYKFKNIIFLYIDLRKNFNYLRPCYLEKLPIIMHHFSAKFSYEKSLILAIYFKKLCIDWHFFNVKNLASIVYLLKDISNS